MPFDADIGFGTSITFASGFLAKIVDIKMSGRKRGFSESTHYASEAAEFVPHRIVDAGELDVDILFDPSADPPISEPAETITISFPLPAGFVTPATHACAGFMTEESVAVPMKDMMKQSVKIKFTGPKTITAAAD